MSGVRCQVLGVRCHVSGTTCHIFVLFFGQSVGAIQLRVCYQRGLAHLVYYTLLYFTYDVSHQAGRESADLGFFSDRGPSGPMLSISQNVRLSARLSVCLFVRLCVQF